jgi:hypothetical protein
MDRPRRADCYCGNGKIFISVNSLHRTKSEYVSVNQTTHRPQYWYSHLSSLYSAQPVNSQHHPLPHITNVHITVYTGINGVLAHRLVWKQKCWSCVDATDCQEVLRGPSGGTNSVLMSNRISWKALVPHLQIMSPSMAAVSTVRERRAFNSSITVYSSCLTQTLLQLLKRISVWVCQVPVPVPDCYRYRGLAACRRVCILLSLGNHIALLCTAVCSTHSSTARCVILFNGDVQQQTSCLRTNVAWQFQLG